MWYLGLKFYGYNTIITFTFFYVFYVFFENPKNVTFYVFCFASHVAIVFRYRFVTVSIPLRYLFNHSSIQLGVDACACALRSGWNLVRIPIKPLRYHLHLVTIQIKFRWNPARSRRSYHQEVLRFVENFGVFVNTFWNQISRNQLGIETRLQWNTYRK